MHILNTQLSHGVSNAVRAPMIVKLCVILQKYLVVYDTEPQTIHQFGTEPHRFSPELHLEWIRQNLHPRFLQDTKDTNESPHASCLLQRKGCSDCKDQLNDHSLQTAGLWKTSPLLSEVLSLPAGRKLLKALGLPWQDRRNV